MTVSGYVAGRFDAEFRIGERLDKDVIAVRLTRDIDARCRHAPNLARRGEPVVRRTFIATAASTGATPAAAASIVGCSRRTARVEMMSKAR